MHLPLHRPTSLPRGRQHASPCVAGGAQQPYNQPARGRSASPGRSTNIQPRRTVKANTAMETVTTTEADDLAARVAQLKAENDALRNEITGGLANMSHAEVAAAAQRLAKQEAALAAAINDVAKRNPQPAAPAAPATPATVSSAAMSAAYQTTPSQPVAPMPVSRTPPRLSNRAPSQPPAPAPTPEELLKAYKSSGKARRGVSRLDFNPKGTNAPPTPPPAARQAPPPLPPGQAPSGRPPPQRAAGAAAPRGATPARGPAMPPPPPGGRPPLPPPPGARRAPPPAAPQPAAAQPRPAAPRPPAGPPGARPSSPGPMRRGPPGAPPMGGPPPPRAAAPRPGMPAPAAAVGAPRAPPAGMPAPPGARPGTPGPRPGAPRPMTPNAPPPATAAAVAAARGPKGAVEAPPRPSTPGTATPALDPSLPSSKKKEMFLKKRSLSPEQQKALEERQAVIAQRIRQREKFPMLAQTPMDIIFVSSEVAPWSKTGGLGDVVGSLPIALADRGHRVMVVAPRYIHGTDADNRYAAATETGTRSTLDLYGAGCHEVGYYHLHKDKVDWVFVDHPVYQREGTPYCDATGAAFEDNVFRYTLLSLAACEAPLCLNIGGFRSGEPPGFAYGDDCIFVANDWHAGLVPCFLASRYRRHGVYTNARTIFAIHNLSHQGVEPSTIYGQLGLPEDFYDPVSWRFPDWARITGPAVNLLKGGIVTSDRIVTVSQGYAWEVTTPEGGWGLHELLTSKGHQLNGITNGIDMAEWNPETDRHIEANYSAEDLGGKAKCKAALQEALGLPIEPDVPLLGFIGRLDFQKGPDLVLDALEELADRRCQVVMLGSGVAEYEEKMREMESKYPHMYRGWVGFSVPVAHQILAGADILLMPSRFEPCGLNQLFAMRYGTVPIGHATGGLRDTIDDFNAFASDPTQYGTGWTFGPPEVPALLKAVDSALGTYRREPRTWLDLQLNGMCRDLSWGRAAYQYEEIFKWAKNEGAICPR